MIMATFQTHKSKVSLAIYHFLLSFSGKVYTYLAREKRYASTVSAVKNQNDGFCVHFWKVPFSKIKMWLERIKSEV